MELNMIIFLLVFFCLYGGINFYAFSRAINIFHFSSIPQVIIIFVMILLILVPVVVRLIEAIHLETWARIIAYIGYIWMVFVFLFFLLSVTFDIARYLYKLVGYDPGAAHLNAIAFGLAVFLAFIFVVYGYFDARRIRVKNLEVHADQALSNNGKIRIVQISDVHVGIIIREKRLEVILDRVREANPDILVSTGDLLDGEINNVLPEAELLAAINPKYGKYAIMGNHEYYAGIKRSLEFTRNAGFVILRDDVVQVAGINIFGADDITGRRLGITKENLHFEKMLAEKHDGFVLLLKHQPYVNDRENFNLQISGHTHGGQIFPFGLVTHFFFSHNYGYYELGKNRLLYVSRGTGTWGPPVRLFAPPEITVIDIIGKKAE
jgi:predicted MPP superfamily phosphohydrolase